MTVSKARQAELVAESAAACDTLREMFPLNSSVPMTVTHVSRNGMSRHIVVFAAVERTNGGRPYVRNVSRLVALATGQKLNRDGDALLVGGCGMSMTFATAYGMGRALYGDSHVCTGDHTCMSNDHSNEWNAPDYRAGRVHADGGYALCDSHV